MRIEIKTFVDCLGYLPYKSNVVIFVKQESDIDKLYALLCEIDSDFSTKKNLIKVLPDKVGVFAFLDNLCEYCGKVELDNEQVEKLKTQTDFLIWRKRNEQ